jgi:hypothetical protein
MVEKDVCGQDGAVRKQNFERKKSEDLHRFWWLHFGKEVLGALLKV